MKCRIVSTQVSVERSLRSITCSSYDVRRIPDASQICRHWQQAPHHRFLQLDNAGDYGYVLLSNLIRWCFSLIMVNRYLQVIRRIWSYPRINGWCSHLCRNFRRYGRSFLQPTCPLGMLRMWLPWFESRIKWVISECTFKMKSVFLKAVMFRFIVM